MSTQQPPGGGWGTPPPPGGGVPPGAGMPPGGMPPGGTPPPPPGQGPLSPQDERTWGMLAHLSGLIAAFIALGVLGPLIVMLVFGGRSPFVRRHAVEALNFQILLLILTAAGIVATVVTLGIAILLVVPLALIALVLALVWIVQGSMAANRGEDYRYPLNLRLVS